MMTMLDKIHKVIVSAGARKGKKYIQLAPIDLLDIANIIGENVVSGGVRRTSEIGLIDQNDEECIQAKSNLYRQVNGHWEIDKSIAHRQMSNNSIFYRKKPAESSFTGICSRCAIRGARMGKRRIRTEEKSRFPGLQSLRRDPSGQSWNVQPDYCQCDGLCS